MIFPKNRYLVFFAGISAIPFVLGTSVGRRAFSYLPMLGMICYGISIYVKSYKPVLAGVVAVYWISAIQKLLAPERSLTWMVLDFVGLVDRKMAIAMPIEPKLLVAFLKYSAAPVEFLIGLMLVFRKSRKWGYIVALIFHALVTYFIGAIPMINGVLIIMLGYIAVVSTFNSNSTLRPTLTSLPRLGLLFLAALAFFTSDVSELFPVPILPLVYIATIVLPFLSFGLLTEQPSDESDSSKRDIRIGVGLVVIINLLWALFPLATDYENKQLGFAMFTANDEHRERRVFYIPIKNQCPAIKTHCLPMVRRIRNETHFGYHAVDHLALQKWHKYLIERCPNEEISPISTEGSLRQFVDSIPETWTAGGGSYPVPENWRGLER